MDGMMKTQETVESTAAPVLEKDTSPVLTLDPFDQFASAPQAPAVVLDNAVTEQQQQAIFDESMFTEEQKKQIDSFVEQIHLEDTNTILQYGAGAQKKIADFSDTALANVRTKDMGEVGELLSGVVAELKKFDEDDDKGFLGLFKKSANKITAMKAKYDKAETNVNKITSVLEDHQVQLLKDTALMDKMYDMNKDYFKELSMYICAGKKKIQQARDVELPALMKKAEETGLPEDAQAVSDYMSLIDRFEKKVHDLELTRMVSLQMAPQIRLVQNNDIVMSEKIQSTIVNTIPLWKSQMVLGLGIAHSTQAAQAQREVTDMTNELLKKNADILKVATIETAKEAERGVVDIETLKQTNASLISTLEDVVKIQDEGRQKRAEAEVELQRMEGELKTTLLQIQNRK